MDPCDAVGVEQDESESGDNLLLTLGIEDMVDDSEELGLHVFFHGVLILQGRGNLSSIFLVIYDGMCT